MKKKFWILGGLLVVLAAFLAVGIAVRVSEKKASAAAV